MKHPLRILLLAPALLVLITGVWYGLIRMGINLVGWNPMLIGLHGPSMAAAFLGTVVSVERAVALVDKKFYIPPALGALGAFGVLIGVPTEIVSMLLIFQAIGMTWLFYILMTRYPSLHMYMMFTASVLLILGNIFWFSGYPLSIAANFWMGFLVITVAGERLELNRLLKLTEFQKQLFIGTNVVILVGVFISLIDIYYSNILMGIGFFGLGLWLALLDIARRTVKSFGIPQFMAIALLSGYFWLLIGGLISVILPSVSAGFAYDARIHSILVGFVFSMIFGHAPVIFPAILGFRWEFKPRLYSSLAILHLGLILRIIGDVTEMNVLRQWGGIINGIAILVFLINTVWSAISGMEKKVKPA